MLINAGRAAMTGWAVTGESAVVAAVAAQGEHGFCTTGAQAVLGEKPNCFKWAWPIPAPVKVVVGVTSGQGLAAAQLFGK